MKKRAKVHLLPTDKASKVGACKYGERKGLFYGSEPSIEKSIQNQHLYITTDDEVKEDDWYIESDTFFETPIQVSKEDILVISKHPSHFCKIIATTDPELNLPQPSKEFIEEYCKVGGIDEVDIEYEFTDENDGICSRNENGCLCGGDPCYAETFVQPKVTSKNEIIIHPIEKKMYTKEEVVQLFRDYQNAKAKQILDGSEPIIPLEWIKENL